MKQTFYVFRHAQTWATKTGQPYGAQVVTAPILEEGKVAIKRIGQYLKPIEADLSVCSQFLRCRQTAQIVTNITNKTFILDSRLNEYNLETFNQFKQRIADFLEEIKQKKYQTIVVCTHGGVIAGFKHLVVNDKLTEDSLPDYPEPGILTIIDEDRVSEIDFNANPAS